MHRLTLLGSAPMDDSWRTYLRFVEPEDAAFICALRSDPALSAHLSPSSPDVATQRTWIERYKQREAEGTEFYFVIQSDETSYGVVRMYDFRDGSFCWGSWIIMPTRPAGLVTVSAVLIYEMGFDCLGFEQSHFDVRLENQRVIDFHLRSGATPTWRDDTDQHFIFRKTDWPAFRATCAPQIAQHRLARTATQS